jgi:hypothetical protein
MAKLTLFIEPELISEAERLAAESQISVSELFSNYIKALYASRTSDKFKLTPFTKKATGVAKIKGDVDYKKMVSDAIASKYHSI